MHYVQKSHSSDLHAENVFGASPKLVFVYFRYDRVLVANPGGLSVRTGVA